MNWSAVFIKTVFFNSQPIYVCNEERKAFADCVKHNSSNTLACKQFMDSFSSCTSKLRI